MEERRNKKEKYVSMGYIEQGLCIGRASLSICSLSEISLLKQGSIILIGFEDPFFNVVTPTSSVAGSVLQVEVK